MIPRTILPVIEERLRFKPVTLITGARQCGKTTLCKLISQKYRNNRWWCFIGSQTVVISHIGRRFTQQICMFVYST